MKHTYSTLKETKSHSILYGLHSDIRLFLMDECSSGNIKSITIKDGGYTDEEVLVKLKKGLNMKFVHDADNDGKWKVVGYKNNGKIVI